MSELDNQYYEYIHSAEWEERRNKRLAIDKYLCQQCGSSGTETNPLQVHHLNYKRIYQENIYTDLVTLCKNCHNGVHTFMNRITSPSGKHGWKDEPYVPKIHVYDDGMTNKGIVMPKY